MWKTNLENQQTKFQTRQNPYQWQTFLCALNGIRAEIFGSVFLFSTNFLLLQIESMK